MENITDTGCCPRFDPSLWDNKEHRWDNKRFVTANVFTLFYMPLNFGGMMRKLDHVIRENGASIQENLCLSEHTSPWNMKAYLAVDKEIPNAKNETISGTFISKVYEGEFKDTGKWMEDFNQYVKEQGRTIKRIFMWYTTCPQCAKVYGKNYVVILGEI